MKAMPYLLSSLLNSQNNAVCINTIFELIQPKDIGTEYGALYAMMRDCWHRHKLIEPVALHIEIMAKYPEQKHYDKLINQLHELWDLVNSDVFWQHYLSLALAEVKLYKLKVIGSQINDSEYNPNQIDTCLTEIKADIAIIIDKYKMTPHRDIDVISSEYLSAIDRAASGEVINKISTGLYYEKYIKGFRKGDFIILAGRPKMGKSAVANTIVAKALLSGKRVMYINNEMDEQQVINRLIANIYDFEMDDLQEPERMSEYCLSQLMDATEHFRKLPLDLYCFTMKMPQDIEMEALRLKDAGSPVDFIVIDYLQLFRSNKHAPDMRVDTANLSWEIKMLAADLGVPVLALAQVNRKCEDRPNKRPVASDLKESGALEQDATAVMFIYRDEVYHDKTNDINIAEINVAINRNGRIGMDKYYVDFDHMKIGNLDTRSNDVETSY